eukprot:556915-Amphidinium_carterae.2
MRQYLAVREEAGTSGAEDKWRPLVTSYLSTVLLPSTERTGTPVFRHLGNFASKGWLGSCEAFRVGTRGKGELCTHSSKEGCERSREVRSEATGSGYGNSGSGLKRSTGLGVRPGRCWQCLPKAVHTQRTGKQDCRGHTERACAEAAVAEGSTSPREHTTSWIECA